MLTYDHRGDAWVADNMGDLYGWQIVATEEWKPGVQKCVIVRSTQAGYESLIVSVRHTA